MSHDSVANNTGDLPWRIGLVMPWDVKKDVYYSRAVTTFASMAENRQHEARVFREQAIDELLANNEVETLACKGLLYFCPNGSYEVAIPQLLNRGIAVGLVRRRMPGAPGLYQAVDDDHRGMEELLRHLHRTLKCQCFCYIGRYTPNSALSARERAFNKYLGAMFGGDNHAFVRLNDFECVEECFDHAMPFILACLRENKKTVVTCYTDNLALQFIDYLRQHGLEVPQDLLVTGYNNDISSVWASPTITTMNIPVEEMVAGACRYLCEYRTRGQFPAPGLVRHFHEIIERESTR